MSGGAVYSTRHGAMCPDCGRPVKECACRKGDAAPADGIVRVARQTAGRRGKGVTVVSGVPLSPSGLTQLCKELKQKCGAGGTVKGGLIEIQGDHRDTLVRECERRGWTVKRAGG